MRILVSEFVCGGGWFDGPRPESLVTEGSAMLGAIVRDLASIPGVQVVTTWDSTLGACPFESTEHITVAKASSPEEERQQLAQLAMNVDVGLVIAPEFSRILADRCRWLRDRGVPLLNATANSIELCADKLELCRLLESQGIATLPTVPLGECLPWEPAVVKLRDGAGSLGMRLLRSSAELASWHKEASRKDLIVQPYVPGRSISVAGLFARGKLIRQLPIAEQRLSNDGTFTYQGGLLPAGAISERVQHSIDDMVAQSAEAIAGLHGYIGWDLLLTGPAADQPVLVEINPRLTTSWIGYRHLFGNSLIQALWRLHFPDGVGDEFGRFLQTAPRPVRFLADGTLQREDT